MARKSAENAVQNAQETKAAKMVVASVEVDVINFKVQDEELLKQVHATMDVCAKAYDGLAAKVAQMLYIVEQRKLYKIEGYSGVGPWALDQYGLAKSTVSEAIKVYGRFGTQLGILSKWQGYSYTALVAMAGLEDAEIVFCEMEPDMSRRQIRDRIAEYRKFKSDLGELPEDVREDIESLTTLSAAKAAMNALPGDEPQSSGDEPQSSGDEPQSSGDEQKSSGDEPQSSGDEQKSSGDEPQEQEQGKINAREFVINSYDDIERVKNLLYDLFNDGHHCRVMVDNGQ